MKSEEFEEHWEEINCKKEPEEGTSSTEGLGAENSEAMEPDSTTSVSREDGDRENVFSKKDISLAPSSKCMFCDKDKMLTKDEYLAHFKVRVYWYFDIDPIDLI